MTTTTHATTSADARRVVEAFIAECLDPACPDAVPAFTTSERVLRSFGGFAVPFPDGRLVPDWLVAEGDRVAFGGRFRGTHSGPWRGIPATGREVEAAVAVSMVVAGGQIVDVTVTSDSLAIAEQVGAVVPLGPRACEVQP
jgi:predicted ester cyclase